MELAVDKACAGDGVWRGITSYLRLWQDKPKPAYKEKKGKRVTEASTDRGPDFREYIGDAASAPAKRMVNMVYGKPPLIGM